MDTAPGVVTHVVVDPKYRRKGVATQLLRVAEKACIAMSQRYLNIMVKPQHEALWTKCGYSLTKDMGTIGEHVHMGKFIGHP